jgi:hypothetical protein
MLNRPKIDPESSSTAWWKEVFRQRLHEGVLQTIMDCFQIHIRDLHVRVEDNRRSNPGTPFCFGLVLESTHIQNDDSQEQQHENLFRRSPARPTQSNVSISQKAAHVNHLGVYWNILEEDDSNENASYHHFIPIANRVLSCDHISAEDIVWSLDQLIARRAGTTSNAAAAAVTAPAHTYLLQPMDVHVQLTFSKTPKDLSQRPAISAHCRVVSDVNIQLRDYQCLQLYQLHHHIQEHYYLSRREYRRFRPTQTALENPRAWWYYVTTVVRYQLGQTRLRYSAARARQRLCERRLYCELYERLLRANSSPDSGAGVGSESSAAARLLNVEDQGRMESLEDGTVGDLSIQDILLFRILVRKLVAVTGTPRGGNSRQLRKSAFGAAVRTMVADNVQAEEEYERLMQVWSAWSSENVNGDGESEDDTNVKACAAVKIVMDVSSGRLTLFSPLAATLDEVPWSRLQERFLEFTYTGFSTRVSLMGDYESFSFEVTLMHFDAFEVRSNLSTSAFVTRNENGLDGGIVQPLIRVHVTKCTPSISDYDVAVLARILGVQISLEPEAEWVSRLHLLTQPLPKHVQAKKFWNEMSLANINSWASRQLGLRAKAEAAVSDHKKCEFDLIARCPVIKISNGKGAAIILDLGNAIVKTKQLAGVAEARLAQKDWTGCDADDCLGRSASGQETHVATASLGSSFVIEGVPDKRFRKRSVFDSGPLSMGGSTVLGAASRFEGSFRGLPLVRDAASAASVDEHGADIFFYDTYELCYQTGSITVEERGAAPFLVSAGCEVIATFRHSILPADHTLFRLKLQIEVQVAAFLCSMSHISLVREFVDGWSTVFLKQSRFTSSVDDVHIATARLVEEFISRDTSLEALEASTGFDENEFFDAMEIGSHASGDEVWMVDSESILDSETRSMGNIRRGRRRQHSISDVSSISDTSVAKKGRRFQDTVYLSAENLAKLEEAGESLSGDGEDRSVADSFQSVVSVSHVMAASREIEEGIVNTESSLLHMKNVLWAVRNGRDCGESREVPSRQAFKGIALEYWRAKAELEGLRAAQADLNAQLLSCAPTEMGSTLAESPRLQASRSVRRASILVRSSRKRSESGYNHHSMTRDLKRSILQVSIVVHDASVEVMDLIGKGNAYSSRDLKSFRLSISESAVVWRKRAGESRIHFDVEGVTISIQSVQKGMASEEALFVGGLDCHHLDGLLGTSLPHLISSPAAEDSFAKGSLSVELRSCNPANGDTPNSVSNLRVVFGDIELKPEVTSIMLIQYNLCKVRDELTSVICDRPQQVPRLSLHQFFETNLRFSAVRVRFGDVEAGQLRTGILLNELVMSDRFQFDLRLSNFQIIAFDSTAYEKGTEILGKKHVYNPLVRLRCRGQLVPDSELGGWVLDQDPTIREFDIREGDVCQDVHHGRVLNLYASLKLESYALALIPRWIKMFKQNLTLLNLGHTDKEGGTGFDDYVCPIRWRIDIQHPPSTLTIREDFVDESNSASDWAVLSWKTSMAVQPTVVGQPGVAIELSFENVSFVRCSDDWTILDPTKFRMEMYFPANGIFCHSMEQPLLRIHREKFYEHPHFVSKTSTSASPEMAIRFTFSSIRINVSAGICLTAREVFETLALVLRNELTAASDGQSGLCQDKEGSLSAKSRSVKTEIFFEDVCVAFYSDGGGGNVLSNKLCLFSVSLDKAVASIHIGRSSASIRLEIADAAVVDYSLRPGVHVFERIVGPERRALVLLSVDITRVGSRCKILARLDIGPGQLLVLPSLLQSIVHLKNELKVNADVHSSERVAADMGLAVIRALLANIDSASVDVNVYQVDCVLSSRSVPNQLRTTFDDLIGAVVVRSKMHSVFLLTSRALKKTDDVETVIDQIGAIDEDSGNAARIANFVQSLDHDETECTLVVSTSDVNMRLFQVLRTAITATLKVPHKFLQTPPASGEQRITNAFSFALVHRLCALSSFSPQYSENPRLVVAHALQFKSEVIDLLSYITRSEGGLSESIGATILPILHILRADNCRKPKVPPIVLPMNYVKSAFVGAPFVFSLLIDGVQITCVPGGATRLAESPIIKLALLRIKAGGSGNAVKSDSIPLPDNDLAVVAAANGVYPQRLMAGCWLTCEISANYHNRRLVAWEPFIEPWLAKVRLGGDLTSFLKLQPTLSAHIPTRDALHGVMSPATNPLDTGGRLRDIGRLFSSPFKHDRLAENRSAAETAYIKSEIDFCFLLLCYTATTQLESAALCQMPLPNTPSWAVLPYSNPGLWLLRFGLPSSTSGNSANSAVRPNSFSCLISDDSTAALNVNLSGALIETIWQFAGNNSESREMAPHVIRNDCGLVSRSSRFLFY